MSLYLSIALTRMQVEGVWTIVGLPVELGALLKKFSVFAN